MSWWWLYIEHSSFILLSNSLRDLWNVLMRYKHWYQCVYLINLLLSVHICDWACKNRAYLHTKFGLIFELQLAISFEVQMLWQWNLYVLFINQCESTESLQNMNNVCTGQEKYYFLNMCNLCRYARFSQAQSHISLTFQSQCNITFMQWHFPLISEHYLI